MQETVFSGIRPAIKQALNWVYGIEPQEAGVGHPQQPQQRHNSNGSSE